MNQIAGKIFQAIQNRQQPANLTLTQGSVMSGRILKLFPDQKAQLQIGGIQMIAQLETALQAGESYWFEVKQAGEKPLLQVVPALGKESPQGVNQLIESLGFKASRPATELVEALQKNKIPFTIPDMKSALSLLANKGVKSTAQQALQIMFQRQLPITPGIFHAISARQEEEMTTRIQSAARDLQQQQPQSAAANQLLKTLLSFTSSEAEQPVPSAAKLVQQLITDVSKGDAKVWPEVQTSGRVPDIKSWQDGWRAWMQQNGASPDMTDQEVQQLINRNPSYPFEMEAVITRLSKNEPILQETQLKNLEQLFQRIQQAADNVLPKNLAEFRDGVSQVFQHQLPASLRGLVNTALQLTASAEKLNLPELKQHTELVMKELRLERDVSLFAKTAEKLPLAPAGFTTQQILKTLMEMPLRLGLNYEHSLNTETNDNNNAQLSLKGLLLQAQQTAGGQPLPESVQQLTNQLTGTQLLQLQENRTMAFIHLQLPGAPFGMAHDIHLDIEGKKQEDNSLQPDFFKVLFYLNLSSLKETVIDMSVQKKSVQLKIYLERTIAPASVTPLQLVLKEGLKQKGYTLSAVQFINSADIGTAVSSKGVVPAKTAIQRHADYKGVDFRI